MLRRSFTDPHPDEREILNAVSSLYCNIICSLKLGTIRRCSFNVCVRRDVFNCLFGDTGSRSLRESSSSFVARVVIVVRCESRHRRSLRESFVSSSSFVASPSFRRRRSSRESFVSSSSFVARVVRFVIVVSSSSFVARVVRFVVAIVDRRSFRHRRSSRESFVSSSSFVARILRFVRESFVSSSSFVASPSFRRLSRVVRFVIVVRRESFVSSSSFVARILRFVRESFVVIVVRRHRRSFRL